MKMILARSILFGAITLPALGELTNADLNQIRLIVNDAIDASEKRFDAKIQASETLQFTPGRRFNSPKTKG